MVFLERFIYRFYFPSSSLFQALHVLVPPCAGTYRDVCSSREAKISTTQRERRESSRETVMTRLLSSAASAVAMATAHPIISSVLITWPACCSLGCIVDTNNQLQYKRYYSTPKSGYGLRITMISLSFLKDIAHSISRCHFFSKYWQQRLHNSFMWVSYGASVVSPKLWPRFYLYRCHAICKTCSYMAALYWQSTVLSLSKIWKKYVCKKWYM